uniref:ATP synthase complex subunit 8 n=1 Tax=Anallacta methanoides TaxID=1661865 RepID=A0A2P1H7T8_9NEOP|nr:ATP synthase F0 subunit 8 [Anallacta methanoides]
MPQMMPLSWLTLYMFFSMTLLLFSFMNYYSYIPKNYSINNNNNKKMIQMHWKW